MPELDYEARPALQNWLERACERVSVEPLLNGDGFEIGHQVVVHNGRNGSGREEAVLATCERAGEAELVAFALWALVKEGSTR